jgi:RHS repeat-associated protein
VSCSLADRSTEAITELCGIGSMETNYGYDPFGVPLVGGEAYNPYQYTGEAWDAGLELLYLRARYYQPEVARFITSDPWRGDLSRPSTFNRYAYVANNPVGVVDPSGLDGGGPGGMCPECRKVVLGYTPLEGTLWDTPGPWLMGGHWWLQRAVERVPLVRQVYVVLRTRLEEAFKQGTGPVDPMEGFVCVAVKEALKGMATYAPMCGSTESHDCAKVAVRLALNALAATVRRINGRLLPGIPFETSKDRIPVLDLATNALPWIERPLSSLAEWDTSGGVYGSEEADPRWDKSYHFFTHTLMAYELRLAGYTPYAAWRMNDWQGRMLEQWHGPYSTNDVIANRWGSGFGLASFEHPEALIGGCTGASCRTGVFR